MELIREALNSASYRIRAHLVEQGTLRLEIGRYRMRIIGIGAAGFDKGIGSILSTAALWIPIA